MSVSAMAMASTVHIQALAVRSALQILSNFDMSPCYELDRRLKADKKLLAEFIDDPEGVAKREVGLVPPPGAHFHFINDKNEYFPPEGDAISQLIAGQHGNAWSRVEVRAAIGPGCVAACIVCS
jgi:hypothetical protein